MASTTSPKKEIVLLYVKLTPYALPPLKMSNRAAGFVLQSAYVMTVYAGDKELILTDLQIQRPEGRCGNSTLFKCRIMGTHQCIS
jgi:hypothetical protein